MLGLIQTVSRCAGSTGPKEQIMDRDDVKNKIDDAADKAKNATDKAADKTKDAAKKVGNEVKDAGDKIKHSTD